MATRKSIDIKGFTHQNPIPNATRIGNTLWRGERLEGGGHE